MEWISVEDDPPPEDKEIIVYGNHSVKVWCTEVYISNGEVLDWSTYRDVKINHWMPLPLPPF